MSADVLTPIVDSPPVAATGRSHGAKLWAWCWPKLLAIGLVLGFWQLVFWSGWKPEYLLPSPAETLGALGELVKTQQFWQAVATTLRRALTGFLLALVIGSAIGIAVSRIRPLRMAVGSLITGLQTMPSIAWFPLAILLFGLNETAILFVVILGAGPSIANGVIAGVDHIPPAFLRLGTVLGARGVPLYRHIVVPAILPAYLAGLNQGWAFAWRSLMAGELLVSIPGAIGIGRLLDGARMQNKAAELLAVMLAILMIGMLVDGLFSSASARMRRKRGLSLDG
ncbi:MAG: ABC transporter permease [Actinomycetes bacterium]